MLAIEDADHLATCLTVQKVPFMEVYASRTLPIHYYLWDGLINDNDQKRGLQLMAELFFKHKPKGAILNLTRLQAGWEPLQHYIVQELLPSLAPLGIKASLVIGDTKDPFTLWSTAELIQRTDGRYFVCRTVAEATAWLIEHIGLQNDSPI
jgi:hypothetical protein